MQSITRAKFCEYLKSAQIKKCVNHMRNIFKSAHITCTTLREAQIATRILHNTTLTYYSFIISIILHFAERWAVNNFSLCARFESNSEKRVPCSVCSTSARRKRLVRTWSLPGRSSTTTLYNCDTHVGNCASAGPRRP